MIPSHLFPLLTKHPSPIYLDSAATALKPQVVIDAVTDYLSTYSSNAGRGLYPLAEQTTIAFETARQKIATFIHASPDEIIFTSGTTDSINLAARLLSASIEEGDNIVTTELEHHSNFLPWKELSRLQGIELRIAPATADGLIDTKKLQMLIDKKTRIIALTAVSNVTGGINPIIDIIRMVREKHPTCIVIIDAAQAVGHIDIDARAWDADFIAFSGHKAYGPTGIGVLFGKKERLETLAPVTFGGGMVTDSCAHNPKYREIPYRFEAGTPNIEGAIGFGAAIDFIDTIGLENIRNHDMQIADIAKKHLKDTFGQNIRILGPQDSKNRSSLISFTLHGIHPHDLAEFLGEKNICIRAGEHCAAPLHRALDLPATARISFGIYTTKEDIERLIEGMKNAREIISHFSTISNDTILKMRN